MNKEKLEIYKVILDNLNEGGLSEKEILNKTGVSRGIILECLKDLVNINAVTENNKLYAIKEDFFTDLANTANKYSEQRDDSLNKSFYNMLFLQREANFSHASFDKELAFYDGVCSGNLQKAMQYSTPLVSEGYGVLSKDKVRNIKYHFIVSVALITRICINNGLESEEAFTLSDMFIQKADDATSENEIKSLHKKMIADYTEKMRNATSKDIYSGNVSKAIKYVKNHLHDKILIGDVASELGISVPYLSKIFSKEVKINFSEYVLLKKIEAACDMIKYSDYNFTEISSILNFSSQSYFIKVFKKFTDSTPAEYKRKIKTKKIFKNQESN